MDPGAGTPIIYAVSSSSPPAQALQDEEVVQQAIEQCGSALSDVLGDAFEESSRQKKIKHVLLDKACIGRRLFACAVLVWSYCAIGAGFVSWSWGGFDQPQGCRNW